MAATDGWSHANLQSSEIRPMIGSQMRQHRDGWRLFIYTYVISYEISRFDMSLATCPHCATVAAGEGCRAGVFVDY